LGDDLRRRGLRFDKCQLKVVDDAIHHGIVCEEGDDAHLAAISGTQQRVDFKDLPNHLGLSVGVEAEAAAGDMTVIRDMGGSKNS